MTQLYTKFKYKNNLHRNDFNLQKFITQKLGLLVFYHLSAHL